MPQIPVPTIRSCAIAAIITSTRRNDSVMPMYQIIGILRRRTMELM